MAASMRDGPSGGNHATTAANFEYDDNEWDIGIGDLIIDLDADIEKTGVGEGSMAAPKPGKMHSPVEHQATVDKGLKMKIKRTKPGTKHEIVKSGENGEKHSNSAKRGSSGHKRDKKHGNDKQPSQKDVNGVVRCVERVVYPVIKTPPIKEKESGMNKKVKGSSVSGCAGGSGNAGSASGCAGSGSGSGGSGSGGVVMQCGPSVPSSPGTGGNPGSTTPGSGGSSNSNSQAPVLSPAQGPSPTSLQQVPSPQSGNGNGGSSNSSTSSTSSTGSSSSGPPGLPQLQPAELPGRSINQHVVSQSSLSSSGSLSPPPLTLQVLPNQSSIGPSSHPTPLRPTSPSPTPPPLNHMPKELVDVCVGTSVGTITEPDCLGPCEPGTSVTLEGIVWHETEGVLVVNVTWRGKTYVGTLLDCTRHDWAPPRFCDSPTSDLDARTPKGRGKRGRTAAHSTLNDLSNFTETRSSVHSKLRSNNANLPKGRRGPGAASPTPFATPKTDATPGKRKTKTSEEEPAPKRKAPPSQPTSPLPPPTLLECPEPNCSKKYKHINGLKYHQSHAHGSPDDDETKESATSEEEEPSPMPEVAKKEELCDMSTQNADESLPELEENTKPIRKYPEEQPSPLEPSPPVLANSAPPIIIPTTPPPPAPSPPPAPILEENANLNIPSQPPVLTKVPQFKVKPASALMSDEKKPPVTSPPNIPKQIPPPTIPQKKKPRKSPPGTPDSMVPSPPGYEELEAGREEVQSPAYSDISDDAAPLLESEVEGKNKPSDKKEESPQLQHFGMYPYYGQPPYLVPSVSEKPKEPVPEKAEGKIVEKEKKESNQEYQQKMLPQHPYYQYGYHVPGFSYNMDGYPVVVDEKKDDKPTASAAPKTANTSTLHIPNPAKPKIDPVMAKDKHQNDNHQILKESIDMKNQVNPGFMYHRQPNRPQEDVSNYYAIYPDRKESTATSKVTPPPPKALPSPSPKHKEKVDEKKDRREEEKKQEGVKPTMETQGPPPPPTSQYAYIHPGYMQSPHYGTLPFEPAVYRGMNPMLVSGYPNSHYLHPQLHAVPRYAPEDLSRSQSGKALDLLQHHASQYYAPSHKIHELQERAIKSPTPKTTTATPSPSSVSGPISTPVTSSAAVQVQGKSSVSDAKDARSPPPQRHVHTHHHTHVGLGYPILAGQYAAPYGAAVLATEHAAAVTSVPYQAK